MELRDIILTDKNIGALKEALKKSYINKYGTNYALKSIYSDDILNHYVNNEKYKIKLIIDNDEIKCFLLYEELTKDIIIDDFNNEISNYIDSEIELINKYIMDIDEQNSIYINYIESFESGYGKIMLNHLKEKYKKIMLYSDSDARDFWEKESFFKVFGFTYIYPPKAIKELAFNPNDYEKISWVEGIKF